MSWWQNLFGGGQGLGAGSGPHPSQHAALTGSSGAQGGAWGRFMGGEGLAPDNPLVTGGLGLGLGLLKGAQPGGGGLGAGLGAGLGGLAQGLLTSHMMKQADKEDGDLTGLLKGFMPKSPGEVGAPPVAGNPPSPSPSAAMNGAPAAALLPPTPGGSGPHPSQFAGPSPGMAQSPPIRTTDMGPPPPMGRSPAEILARPLQQPGPITQSELPPPPMGGGAPPPTAPPPMPMQRPPMPQLPMPGMAPPAPSGVGGLLFDAHRGNPGIGGPRMGPTVPMAGMQPPGMQQASMGIGMSPNDLMRLPPEIRARMIGGMF